jgi:hypothetical protein
VLSIEPADTLYIFSGNQIIGSFGNQTHINTRSNPLSGAIGCIRSKVEGVATFPLGDGTYYLPATLTLSSVGLNEFSLAVFRTATVNGQANGAPFSNVSSMVNSIWLINRILGSTATDITLAWNEALEGTSFSSALNSDIGISRYDGSLWDPVTGEDGDNNFNMVTRYGVNDFSPFLVAIIGSDLPLKFGNISAARMQKSVQVIWEALSEDNVAYYEVQKSSSGASFNVAGKVTAVAQNLAAYKYVWTDSDAGSSTVFYRIKAIDKDGKISFSPTVRAKAENGWNGLKVYPNPLPSNGRVNIEAGALSRGSYKVEFIDMSGIRSFSRMLEHRGGGFTQNIELSKSLKPGTYVMKLSGENISYTATVVVK